MIRYIALCLGLILIFSCGPKQTKLILLPQDNGEIGAVTLNTGKEIMILDKPYTTSQSGKRGVEKVDPELIKKTYGQLFKAEIKKPPPPPPMPAKSPLPTQFSLYFESNSLELTQESKPQLADIITYIQNHPPVKIRVIGYADTLGSNETNLELSKNRASLAAKRVTKQSAHSFQIEIRGYGEHGLKIQTPNEIPEPLNRRVTIWIE